MAARTHKDEEGREYTNEIVEVSRIVADRAVQPRVEMDMDHVKYLATMAEEQAAQFVVDVVFDGKKYWLFDGFHRLKALLSLKAMGTKYHSVKVRKYIGTRQTAVEYAAQANRKTMLALKDVDRRQAMFNLLQFPEWQIKTFSELARAIGLSSATAAKYSREFHDKNGIPMPKCKVTTDGRSIRTPADKNSVPNMYPNRTNGFSARIGKKKVCFPGKSPQEAESNLRDLMDRQDRAIKSYRISSIVYDPLCSRGIFARKIDFDGISGNASIHGLNYRGIAITTTSFEKYTDPIEVVGRASACKKAIGASRVIVLCPKEGRPEKVLALFGEPAIEYMTIDEFIAMAADLPDENEAETA